MEIDDLMKPRYKCIADYPYNISPAGSIIENPSKDFEKQLKKYPDIFKSLEWWEDRKPEDMPEYVKVPHYPNGEKDFIIEHIDGDFIKHEFTCFGYFGLKYKNAGGKIVTMFTPATKEEYEHQNK